MAATDNNDGETSRTDDQPLFEESGGLFTESDLRSQFGTSPVTIATTERMVEFKIGLGGGHVSAHLQPERAREAAEALLEAADVVEGRSDE